MCFSFYISGHYIRSCCSFAHVANMEKLSWINVFYLPWLTRLILICRCNMVIIKWSKTELFASEITAKSAALLLLLSPPPFFLLLLCMSSLIRFPPYSFLMFNHVSLKHTHMHTHLTCPWVLENISFLSALLYSWAHNTEITAGQHSYLSSQTVLKVLSGLSSVLSK